MWTVISSFTLLLQASDDDSEHEPDAQSSSTDAQINIHEDSDGDAPTRSTNPAGASLANALSSSVPTDGPAAAPDGGRDGQPLGPPVSEANDAVQQNQGKLLLLPASDIAWVLSVL